MNAEFNIQSVAALKEEREYYYHTKMLEILGHRGLSELTREENERAWMYADLKMSERVTAVND